MIRQEKKTFIISNGAFIKFIDFRKAKKKNNEVETLCSLFDDVICAWVSVRCTDFGWRAGSGWRFAILNIVICTKFPEKLSFETITDVTFSFAVSIQHREQNQTSGVITYKHFCGGVLLQVFNRTGYVITASHCMVNMYEGFGFQSIFSLLKAISCDFWFYVSFFCSQ